VSKSVRILDPKEIVERAIAGDRSSLSRAISLIEANGPEAEVIADLLWSRPPFGHTVGITGAPGAGKSSLTDRLIGCVRSSGEAVAVVAIDPSSPYSGGAILGDRVRMSDHSVDNSVFIRSLATRGHSGGLSESAPQVARALDAAGFQWVLLETVGVGQAELEVASTADTTVVVVNPGWGDAVQANKAGLMEIADIFVVNKADRPGAADTENEIQSMLHLSGVRRFGWTPPVVRTSAVSGMGVDELWHHIGRHRTLLESDHLGEQRTAERMRAELRRLIKRRVDNALRNALQGEAFDSAVRDVRDGVLAPADAASTLLARISFER
jgi:LAO/AO transport system kinase